MTSGTAPVPAIEGYDFVQLLGRGSAAMVYLYRQREPGSLLAVKVGRNPLDQDQTQALRREADLMAELSEHPYVLTIHQTGISAEGLGYLVLDYAPRGSYKELIRQRPRTGEQTLDLGVKLASALAQAHRKGIIHRDIKPSNILIGQEGQPLLSDFGISTTIYQTKARTGFSIPWAPPEVLTGHSNGTESADIYSLGATLFACLSGRSPYEYGYQPKTQDELMGQIINRPLPSLDVPGVPKVITRCLAKALAKDPDDRYRSALEFARALQQTQQDCYGQAQPLVVEGVDEYPPALLAGRKGSDSHAGTWAAEAGGRSRGVALSGGQRSSRHHRKAWIIAGVVAIDIAAIALAFTQLVLPNMDSKPAREQAQVSGPGDLGDDRKAAGSHQEGSHQEDLASVRIPAPQGLTGQANDQGASFSWSNPAPRAGDSYAWSLVHEEGGQDSQSQAGAAPGQLSIVNTPTVSIQHPEPGQICIQVSIVRANGQMSDNPATACVTKS
ncbi:serine/threonine-protein kinase [Bifidobacterium aemilianum]|nr:serine/threonine-protein kinase [Bifidobacterium aemilianum]